ncbi:YkvA family protein [Devosia sp. Naph2]|uniref:YkvA family protein n=1 Tax=Devosia polycyclovorans TaxID=3345148 RepID=UPI0035D0DA2A
MGRSLLEAGKKWARSIKRDVVALSLAARDRRTPWAAKILAGMVAAYALSPIDLIPDFVPILGYLDDVLIVPLGILIVVRMIPVDLMAELRAEAARRQRPVSRIGLVVIVLVWLLLLALIGWWVGSRFAMD